MKEIIFIQNSRTQHTKKDKQDVCFGFLSHHQANFKNNDLLYPTGHVMHHQFNIQQLYALPTLYLCVLYLSENKQRLAPLTA